MYLFGIIELLSHIQIYNMNAFLENLFTSVAFWWAVKTKWMLQQDLIDHTKWYEDRSFRFIFWRRNWINNTMVDLWEWPTDQYVFPSSPMQMKVVSTSSNDTTAWTGARKIRVDWLDENYNLHVDEISLNWTTPVNFAFTNMFRINYAHVMELGTSASAQWDISITDMAWTVTYCIIKSWNNTARQAIWTVPSWFTWYVSHWQSSSWSMTWNHFTQMTMKSTAIQWVKYAWVFLLVDETWTSDNWISITFPIPIRIPEKIDFKMTAVSDSASANVTWLGAVMGWFELNP